MTLPHINTPKYKQLLFVVVAFVTMIVVSAYYVSEIVQSQIRQNGNLAMNSATATIRSLLSETEVTLLNTIYTVESMLDMGVGQEEIESYLRELTSWLYSDQNRYFAFSGIYGIVDGKYVDGNAWIPPEDYVPELRPWFIGAIRHPEKIFYTAPYVDAETGLIVMSLSRTLRNNADVYMGILSIDVNITGISDYVTNLRSAGNGYGLLLNERSEIMTHREQALIGHSLIEINDDYRMLRNLLWEGKEISALEITDYNDTKSVVFLAPLFNGWNLGIVIPTASYYDKIRTMTLVLGCLGVGLMSALCLILLRLYNAMERADEENKSKSSFLATMSHEIRTPMNAIAGMSELILRDADQLPQKTRSYALGIKQASANLLSIINDILDLSKIQAGKLDIVPINYMLSSLLNDTVNIIRMRLRDKPIIFVVNIDANLPNNLYGDEVRVRQLLLNLLSNAVKYTHEGFISLTINGDVHEDEGLVRLNLVVEDSGIGIKDEYMDKLFGDFVRVRQGATKNVEGTGLGLAITKKLSRQMGGDVTVESTFGKGSIFTLTLPQRFYNSAKFAVVKDAKEKPVLALEPRPVYAQSLVYALTNLGVPHTVVAWQSAFLEALEQQEYYYILLPEFLYGDLRSNIQRFNPNAKIALAVDSSEAPSWQNTRMLNLPIHSMSVANVLNNVPEAMSYGEEGSMKIGFCYPKARILIVDDIITNLKVAEGLFLPYEMQMDFCQSGEKAIELAQQNNYDIIFMDHMMPGMDGIEATNRIRALDGVRFKKLPIVALTANAVSGMKEMFLENGMNDFLAKPIETPKLNAILLKWIPHDKRERKGDAPHTASQASAALPATPLAPELKPPVEIDGVNVNRGIITTGGSFEAYLAVLKLFRSDAMERVETLKNALANDDLKLYGICVHALKSAAANIGAEGLSSMAQRLEQAATANDRDFLANTNPFFLQDMTQLCENIGIALDSITPAEKRAAGTVFAHNADKLPRGELFTLKKALEEMNMASIDQTLGALMALSLDTATKNDMESLSSAVLVSEYDDALVIVDRLLGSAKE